MTGLRRRALCAAFLAFSTIPAAAQTDAGDICDGHTGKMLREIFTELAPKADITWSGGKGFDPKSGLPVFLLFNDDVTYAELDCKTLNVGSGDSIAATTQCDKFIAIAFGHGICTTPRTVDQAAFVVAHELSHVGLRHLDILQEETNKLFADWVNGEGSADFQELKKAETAKIQRQIDAEHPELASIHDIGQINAILDSYKQQEADELSEALFKRFTEAKKLQLQTLGQDKETEADKSGLFMIADSKYDHHQAAEMLQRYGELRKKTDLQVDTEHPPADDRAAVVRRLSADLDGNISAEARP